LSIARLGRTLTAMDKGLAVLVIEDDPDVVQAARLALSEGGAQIHSLNSMRELEACTDSMSFDAVLLDMNLAVGLRDGSDGLEGLGRVQAADATLAVVLMTAYAGVSLAVESLKRGAADFVMKPWRNDRLTEAVFAAAEITRRRRADENRTLDSIEQEAIERALSRHEGNISVAADALGLSRAALYRRKARYGL
jgi:two-component system response regulator RegA